MTTKNLYILLGLAICALLVPTLRAEPTGESQIYLPLLVGIDYHTIPYSDLLDDVTDITNAGDNRLFAAEKVGRIQVIQPNGSASVFLDIRQQVVSNGFEQGLLGLAFHPDYAKNGWFYVTYIGSRAQEGWTLFVSRFSVSADPNSADPNSEMILAEIAQLQPIHNGGDIGFAPNDSWLWVSTGDDWMPSSAQEFWGLYGRIIRFNINAPLRTDQPYYDDGRSVVNIPYRIKALGLRNPWRFAIDPQNGNVFIGDVGETVWEEVNYALEGEEWVNFGWPCYEGPDIFNDEFCEGSENFVQPIHTYPHPLGCAVVAGAVYRATPDDDPQFIFGDYCSQEVFTMYQDGGWQVDLLGTINQSDVDRLNTFGTDNFGRVYSGLSSFTDLLPIYQLVIP